MSAIRGKDTKPELTVRSVLHRLGFRFSLHRKDLPGRPDIYLAKHQTVVFVHGCFWHTHDCKYGKVIPKTNADFWKTKRQGNVMRDKQHAADLRKAGITQVVVWECETRDPVKLGRLLLAKLESAPAHQPSAD
jgi:DNA mismatch endonuclease, patch repair protein